MTAPAAERAGGWPSAEAVAQAIVVAARLEGEDPVLTAEGARAMRGRVYAFVALAHHFPTVPRAGVAGLVGARAPDKFVCNLRLTVRRENSAWFDLGRLNAVCAELEWASPMTQDDAVAGTFAAKRPDGKRRPDAPPQKPSKPRDVVRMATIDQALRDGRPSRTYAEIAADLNAHAVDVTANWMRVRAQKLGLTSITAAAMGDPEPGRSALAGRETRGASGPARRDPDEAFMERWQFEQAKARNEARAGAAA